jgi:hypothetical protein
MGEEEIIVQVDLYDSTQGDWVDSMEAQKISRPEGGYKIIFHWGYAPQWNDDGASRQYHVNAAMAEFRKILATYHDVGELWDRVRVLGWDLGLDGRVPLSYL